MAEIKWNYGEYEYDNFPCIVAFKIGEGSYGVAPATIQDGIAYAMTTKEKIEHVYAWTHFPEAPKPNEEIFGVNHPSHYNRDGAIECIDEMELLFGKEETATWCKLNTWKYRYRAGEKPGEAALKDLKKSDWYMNKYKELKEKGYGTITFNKPKGGFNFDPAISVQTLDASVTTARNT